MTQSYLTDATKVIAVFGSKDQELLAELTKKLSKQFDELNDWFEDEITSENNAQEILKDIVNGEIRFPNLGYMYSYVYEKIVEHYGKIFFPTNMEYNEYSTNYYWDVPKEETYKAFMPIPFSDDFPEVYSIEKENLKAEKALFLSVTKRSDDVDEDYLKIEKEGFEFAFDKAISKNKDLVFFLY